MRALTQVWFFFLTLTFLFLLLGFHLAGRAGLFIAFIVSVILVYATLQRGITLFKKKLNAHEFSGNDPSGFLTELNKNKLNFGFRKLYVYKTSHKTPPLIWKSKANEGHILLHEQLLDNLNVEEIRLSALLFLSHLENRSFLVTPILSVINQSLLNFKVIVLPVSILITTLFRTPRDILESDKKFKLTSDASHHETGYLINKLHNFDFHHNKKVLGTEYFSVLSISSRSLNQYGIPSLESRLKHLMGFSLSK